MAKIGDKIKIISMRGEPHYDGKIGLIEEIGKDPYGHEYMRGTWGYLSIYPEFDTIEILSYGLDRQETNR